VRVLAAPNAFKGSLSGPAAARALARGARAALPGAATELLPLSDGGDGLVDAVGARLGGRAVSVAVRGPLGERRRASYLLVPSRRLAVIEMARASGLALVPPRRRRVLAATTYGVGQLVRDAVRRGAKTVLAGLGGSASNDGGAGLAQALGARLLDASGRELPPGAEALLRLDRADAGPARRLLAGVKVIGLTDVDNPLCGPRGSARVFGPQKGASRAQVRVLERALERWAKVLARDLGVRVARTPGAAAAGGLGAGLLAFAGAELVPGADWVLDLLGADAALSRADLVLTGEGRLDATSLGGKAPVALARRARRAGVPCAAVAGEVEAAALPALRRAGIARAVSFAQAGSRSSRDSLRRAAHWAAQAASRAATLAAAGALLLAFAPRPARAEDARLSKIDAAYFHRNEAGKLAESLALIDAAPRDLPAAESSALAWRRCRSLIRRGEDQAKKKDKLADFDAARGDCERAVALSSSSADAHFWLGVALGRWGQAKGILKALFLIKPIRAQMHETLALDPSFGGAHHVLGEMLWQIPGFAGGDKKQALKEFETAVRLSPDHGPSYQPLAEAYLHFGRKDDAIRTLKACADIKHPADPAEYPENRADALKLLKTLER
jgi:glycerate kinase